MTPEEITPGPEPVAQGASGTYEYIEEVVEYRDTRKLRILLITVLTILVLLLATLSYVVLTSSSGKGGAAKPTGSNEMVWVRSIYGWGTGEDQHLITPNSVAVGPDGLIWTNSRNRYAVAFNPDGSFDRVLMSNPSTATSSATSEGVSPDEPQAGGADSLSPMGQGQNKTPGGAVAAVFSLDVDADNNLYIGDDSRKNVLKFTPEGKLEQGWNIPGLVKLAANDSRVAVIGKGNIGVFAQDTGAPVFGFGTRGQGAEQFDLPVGVHIDEAGNVYVADTQNQRVRKYGPSGRLLWDAGTVPDRKNPKTHDARNAEASKGIFELPTGVTVDGNGRVVVVDAFKYQIIVLDGETGKKLADYGEYGPADGQFTNPSAITYDADRDYFIVADTDNNRLQVVRIPGSSAAPVQSVIRRAFDRPVWILCLPFLVLLIAALVTALVSRRRVEQPAA